MYSITRHSHASILTMFLVVIVCIAARVIFEITLAIANAAREIEFARPIVKSNISMMHDSTTIAAMLRIHGTTAMPKQAAIVA